MEITPANSLPLSREKEQSINNFELDASDEAVQQIIDAKKETLVQSQQNLSNLGNSEPNIEFEGSPQDLALQNVANMEYDSFKSELK